MNVQIEELEDIYTNFIRPEFDNKIVGMCIYVASAGYEELTKRGYDFSIEAGYFAYKAHPDAEAKMYGGDTIFNEKDHFNGHTWLIDNTTGNIIDFTAGYATERYLHNINDDEKVYENLLGDKDFLPTPISSEEIIDGTVGYYYLATPQHTKAATNKGFRDRVRPR